MLFSTSYNQNLRQATQLLQPSTPFNSFYYIPDITKPNEKCFFTKDTKIQPNMVLYASSDILPKRNKDVAYFLPDGTDIGDVPILNPRTCRPYEPDELVDIRIGTNQSEKQSGIHFSENSSIISHDTSYLSGFSFRLNRDYANEMSYLSSTCSDYQNDFFIDENSTYAASVETRSIDSENREMIPFDPLHMMLLNMVPNDTISRLMDNVIDQSDIRIQDFLYSANPMELEQEKMIYQNITKNSFLANYKAHFKSYKDLIQTTVNQHRFVAGREVSHFARIAITGPAKSGKSTLLAHLAKEFMIDMLHVGDAKKTFFVPIDIASLSIHVSDKKQFLEYMVDLTFDMIHYQRPTAVTKNPRKTLKSIFSHRLKLPEVDPRFEEIADNLTTSDMEYFIQLVLDLPYAISHIYGFEHVFYILDNFEFCDIVIDDLFFVENVKRMIDSENYIISTGDFGCLEATMENGIYLSPEFITTYDVIEVDEEQSLIFTLDGSEERLEVSVNDCGGVAPFVDEWNELYNTFVEYEKSPDQDEILFDLLGKAHMFLNLVDSNEHPLGVIMVERSASNAQ